MNVKKSRYLEEINGSLVRHFSFILKYVIFKFTMQLNHEQMHSDNIGIEQTTLKKDIPTVKEIVPAIS